MKIAIFHNLTSGGGKRALEGYCRGLHEKRHSLDLFIMDTADEVYLPLDKYINKKKIFKVSGEGLFKFPDYNSRSFASGWKWLFVLSRIKNIQKRIADEVNKSEYDLALVCGCIYTQSPFILRFLKIPSVYLCQEPLRTLYESPRLQDLDNLRGKIYLSCAGFILKNLDAKNIASAKLVIANSYYSRESILRVYGIDSKVNYLGVDTEKFRPLSLVKENMILSLGGLQPRKGYRFIIKSLAEIDRKIRPKFIILADKYYYEEGKILKDLARDLEVDLYILINVSDNEVVNYYNRAKAVVFAPYLEPFGFVVLEAMACQVPVIAVKEGGIREIVINGQNGILLDRDEVQLAGEIEKIITDPREAQIIAANAREYVRNSWSWDAAVNKLVYSFNILLEKRQRQQ